MKCGMITVPLETTPQLYFWIP